MVRRSNQQASTTEELPDKYQPLSIKTKHHDRQRERSAVSTGDVESESPVHDKYAVSIQSRRAQIEYLAFGEDTIVESKRCTSSDDEAALEDERHDTETRRCDPEFQVEEKRSGPESRMLSYDDSQYSNFLNKDFSSEADIRDFACSHVSNEQTPRSLICDFQRDDFALQMSESLMDSESSESFEDMILTDSKSTGVNAAEIDQVVEFHSGLRLKVKTEDVPIAVTNGEKVQQSVANSSLEKPLVGMYLEKTEWETAVTEAICRERAAIQHGGECSVDAVLGVVNDLCLMGSIDEVSQKTSSVDLDYKMGAEQDLRGLKKVLSKRPLSPLSPCSPKQSTRKSDLSAALSDLCFMGDPKKLERPASTLLLETAVREFEKTSAETLKYEVERDHPFDEQESLMFSLIRMIDEVLVKNGNPFMSNDLVDLSGNVSLVPVSSTLTFRHPVMAAVALEDNHFPACGDWQLGEIEEIVKDIGVWMKRKATEASPASDTEANSEKQMSEASQKRSPSLKTEVNGKENSSREAMKHALHSPRRSYSTHKFSRKVETTAYVCGLCVSRSGMVAGKDDSLLGLIRVQDSRITESDGATVSVPYDEASGDKIDILKDDVITDEMSTARMEFEAGIFSFNEFKVHEIKYRVARVLPTIQNGMEGLVIRLKEYLMFVPLLEAYIAAHNAKVPTSKRSYFNACQFELSLEAIQHVKSWILGLFMTKGCANATPSPNAAMLAEGSSSLTGESRISLPDTHKGRNCGTSIVQDNTSTGQNKASVQLFKKALQEAANQANTSDGANVLEIDGALNTNVKVKEMVTNDGLVGCDGFEVDDQGVVSPTGPVEVTSSPCSKHENVTAAASSIVERFYEFTSCGKQMDAIEDLLFDETVKDLPFDEMRDAEQEISREVSSDETTNKSEAAQENRSSGGNSTSNDTEQINGSILASSA